LKSLVFRFVNNADVDFVVSDILVVLVIVCTVELIAETRGFANAELEAVSVSVPVAALVVVVGIYLNESCNSVVESSQLNTSSFKS
jgi:hypothetical protein